MKKVLIFCLLASGTVRAQEYKPFKVNLSVGYGHLVKGPDQGRPVFSIEPQYRAHEHLDVGIRLEGFSRATPDYQNGNRTIHSNSKKFFSGLATVTYRFQGKRIQPLVGGGIGLYSIGYSGTQYFPDFTSKRLADWRKTPGYMARIGVKKGHLTAVFEYNGTPKRVTPIPITFLPSPLPATYIIDGNNLVEFNTYASLKIGVDIGGGKR